MSTTAISKPVFQEVDATVILPLTFIKERAFPGPRLTDIDGDGILYNKSL